MRASESVFRQTGDRSTVPFLLLKENRFAQTAVRRLQEKSRQPTDSLVYVYGPSGVGKTHLVRHLLREIHRQPANRVAHVTASQFAAELAEASAEKSIDRFQQRFRQLDLLMCEDLSALENRSESQQQLVWAMDEILVAGGRCLLTCRTLPGGLSNMLPRLLNRCRAGVCAPIALPGRSSRIALIDHFSLSRQMPLPRDVVEFLAANLAVSPRELLAAVLQLETSARHEKSTIDLALAQRYVRGEVTGATVTLAQITRCAAREFGLNISDIRGRARLNSQVLARHCAMFLSRELTGKSLQAIAEFFGGRRHSTVAHACRQLEKKMADEPALRQHLAQICHRLGVKTGPFGS